MSFEPTIIINRTHLEKAAAGWDADHFEEMNFADEDARAKKYLLDLLKQNREVETRKDLPLPELVISGVRLLICTPELTSFNRMIRECLEDHNIEFGIDN